MSDLTGRLTMLAAATIVATSAFASVPVSLKAEAPFAFTASSQPIQPTSPNVGTELGDTKPQPAVKVHPVLLAPNCAGGGCSTPRPPEVKPAAARPLPVLVAPTGCPSCSTPGPPMLGPAAAQPLPVLMAPGGCPTCTTPRPPTLTAPTVNPLPVLG